MCNKHKEIKPNNVNKFETFYAYFLTNEWKRLKRRLMMDLGFGRLTQITDGNEWLNRAAWSGS